jgi:drug/metabolite transporter (DMT)-like permease
VSRRAWFLFIAISALWGLPYLLIKVAISEVDPSVIVFARVSMSAVVLLPLALANGALQQVRRRWRAVLALSFLEVVLPFLLIAYGEQHITSSLAGLLIAADPLFIVLLALRFDRSERTTGTRLIGLCLGFVGVVFLLGLDPGGDALGLLGGAMVLLAALCYAGGALLIKRVSDIPPVGSVTASLGIAAVWLAPLASMHVPSHVPSGPVLASLLALGLVCTALGFLTYFSLIAEAGATRASLITYVNPAVAVVLGVSVLHEPVTAATFVGFGLILAGCWLSTRPAFRSASEVGLVEERVGTGRPAYVRPAK